MRSIFKSLVFVGASLLAANVASATSVNTSFTAVPNENVTSIADWDTRGNDMGGMSVTVAGFTATGGTFSQTVMWGTGGAIGSGWSLSMANMTTSTFDTQWLFDVAGDFDVTSITIDGGVNVVFDTWFWDHPGGIGTPGSLFGLEFTIDSVFYNGANQNWPDVGTSELGTISVNYSNAVTLNGAGAVGDLFGTMTITFDDGNLFGQDSQLSFWADTDNVTNPVPEPATMVLLGLGLMGVVGGSSLRRKTR